MGNLVSKDQILLLLNLVMPHFDQSLVVNGAHYLSFAYYVLVAFQRKDGYFPLLAQNSRYIYFDICMRPL